VKVDILFSSKQSLPKLLAIVFMLSQVLLSPDAKATETNKSINENLFNAAYNLEGSDRKLCLFVAIDSSSKYEDEDTGQEPDDEPEFPIAWLQGSHSLTASRSGLSVSKLKDAVIRLRNTQSGANLIELLEQAGIREKYEPITIHIAKTSSFIDSNLPVAFNSLITIKDKKKAFPFIVFNQEAMNKKYTTERKISVVLANELFDVLGRLILGDDITATSDYQALGIVLSDITLEKEIRRSNHKISKQEIINLFNKALKDYSSFVPPLEEALMNEYEKAKLDSLTSLVSSGVFNNFSELKSMSIHSANYVANN
jgi:hypothetical protein